MTKLKRVPSQGFIFGVMLLASSLSVPPLRIFIEQSMFVQMVIQIPILLFAGAMFSSYEHFRKIFSRLNNINVYGLSGLMLAQMILIYWMLPLNIDRAVVIPWVDGTKVISMVLAGLLVGEALQKSPVTIQLFFIGYFSAMMVWLGLYFLHTDLRLCNAYSLNSQHWTGYGLIFISICTVAYWSIRVLKNKSSI